MKTSITRYRNGELLTTTDELSVENPLLIQLHSTSGSAPRAIAVTMRTPGRDADLALGFLFSEGILVNPRQVISATTRDTESEDRRNTVLIKLAPGVDIDWKRLERHGYTSSSCGVCGKTSLEQVHAACPFPETLLNWRLSPEQIISAPEQLREAQANFAKTGGIHGAGLLDLAGKLLHHAEDVGRHNAVDKLIGHAFQQDWLPLEKHLLVLSGRASFELIQKAAMAGIRMVVAVGAPSSLAVELARDAGICLAGFVRDGGFNLYSFPERVNP